MFKIYLNFPKFCFSMSYFLKNILKSWKKKLKWSRLVLFPEKSRLLVSKLIWDRDKHVALGTFWSVQWACKWNLFFKSKKINRENAENTMKRSKTLGF